MNYKHQIHFLNDITMWRAHVLALINMNIIKSPLLHQCRLHSNGNGFKIVQKSFIKSSSNLQEANHLGFSCQHFRYPCVNYLNGRKLNATKVRKHLICDGFLQSYTTWTWHGKSI